MSIDLSSGKNEASRNDVHTPVNFLPENYAFAGAYHNSFSFYNRSYNTVADRLRSLLAQNPRPHGPGDTQCDHCGAHIAFVGVFRHIASGEYIAVGAVCAENRFPLSNAEFQQLRKAHKLDSARRRSEAQFKEFQAQHPEIDWAAAASSTNSRVQSIMRDGAHWGNLFDYKLRQLSNALAPAPAVVAPAAPSVSAEDQAAYTWIAAYNGSNSFLNSLKEQHRVKGTLSPKQLACLKKNVAEDTPAAQAKAQANQQLRPGVYVDTQNRIWLVKGNGYYTRALKAAKDALKADENAPEPHSVAQAARGARVYGKVWSAPNGDAITIDSWEEEGTSMDNDSAAIVPGHWSYDPAGFKALDIDHHMHVNEARKFISLYNECVRCGRHLEAKKSLDAGIGPVCITYFPGWNDSSFDHSHQES